MKKFNKLHVLPNERFFLRRLNVLKALAARRDNVDPSIYDSIRLLSGLYRTIAVRERFWKKNRSTIDHYALIQALHPIEHRDEWVLNFFQREELDCFDSDDRLTLSTCIDIRTAELERHWL